MPLPVLQGVEEQREQDLCLPFRRATVQIEPHPGNGGPRANVCIRVLQCIEEYRQQSLRCQRVRTSTFFSLAPPRERGRGRTPHAYILVLQFGDPAADWFVLEF